MDSSPEKLSKPNSSTASPPLSEPHLQVQESPVFSYLSNLSPIKPDTAVPVAQGFPGINSPPLVFRSPQINPNSQPTFLKRPQFAGSSDAGLSGPGLSGQDKSCGDTVTVAEDSGTSVSASSANLTPKNSEDFLKSQNDFSDSKESVENTEDKDGARTDEVKMGASSVLEQVEEDDLTHSLSDVKSVVLDQKTGDGNMPPDIHQNVEPTKSVDRADHALDNQHGVHSNAENAGSVHVFEVGCASLSESLQIAEHSGNCLENAVVPCAEALEKKMHDHSPKVIQHQHGISRRLQFDDAIGKIMESTGFQNSSGNAGYPRSPASPANSEVLESASLNKPASPSNRLLANKTPPFLSAQNSGNCNVNVLKPSGIGLHLNSIVNSMQMGSGAKLSMKSAELGRFDGLANSASSLSPYSMNPLYEAVLSKPTELQSDFSNKRMPNSETSDSFEDFGQSSPKKKRKKTLDTGDSNDCKRCNCKKTKCLKLYCDCFAAGIYCAEPCACQDCFNRPEYEDTVLETRQQIESRNPQAFGPKIIQHLTEPPTNVCVEDGAHFTPSSARHKRGCNCKKSKCLKKYCECYQANVGCSDGCRCEACENIYGRKGEFSMIKDLISKHNEKLDSSFDTIESLAPNDGLLHNELYNPRNLTPLTPSLQCSDHGKGPSKAWLSSAGYLQSPESGQTFIAPYGMPLEQATNPDNHGMIPEANTEAMDLVSFGQGLDNGNGHTVNQFIPRWGVLRNAGHFTALPNPQDWENTSRAQIFPGNRQVSSANSLRWRSSPITPSTHSGGTKLQEVVDSDGLYNIMDDDTPEILKETPEPPNGVKVSSPNKKRVSPPRGRTTELSSSSSAGLRTGRKFILQAVPSFPPLTPCIDSKGGNGVNNSQNSTSSK